MSEPTDVATQHALAALGCAADDLLQLGGIEARELAARFGTPLYVFAADVLDARFAAVRHALGPRLHHRGAGAEVASLGELHLALAAGHRAADLRSFLSHPAPAEVLVEAGQARVVRARGEVTDVLRGQSP